MTYIRKVFMRYAIVMLPKHTRERKLKKALDQHKISPEFPPQLIADIRRQELLKIRAENDEYITKLNIHPGKAFVMIGVEAAFWISLMTGLRNICAGYPPDMAADAPKQMSQQGFLWFSDLTVPDPYYILPGFASFMFLFSFQVRTS